VVEKTMAEKFCEGTEVVETVETEDDVSVCTVCGELSAET